MDLFGFVLGCASSATTISPVHVVPAGTTNSRVPRLACLGPCFRQCDRALDYPDGTIKNGEAVPGVLLPGLMDRVLPSGRTRNVDVQQFSGSDGQDRITHEGGTSLFDRAAVLPRKTWTTFRIPKAHSCLTPSV